MSKGIGKYLLRFLHAALRRESQVVFVVLLFLAVQVLFMAIAPMPTQLVGIGRGMLVLAFFGLALTGLVVRRSRRTANTFMQRTANMRARTLDKVQEGVTLANLKRELVYVNDAYLRMTGYSREELLGKPCGKKLQGAETSPITAELIRTAVKAGQPFQGEILNYRKDGTTFWNELSITPIFDEAGVLLEYFGVQRDITNRKDAELALKTSQEQLKLVLKGTADGVWAWNLDDDQIERSLSWCQMLGYEEQDLPSRGDCWAQIIHADELSFLHEEMERLRTGDQERYSMQLRVQHKDGHYVPVLSRGYIQRDENGRATRIYGSITNLTDQKDNEAKLTLAAAVFLQSREGIAMTDANRNIIMVNRAFSAITGYTEADVLGQNLRILASARHGPEFYTVLWNEVDTTDHWVGEIWDRRKNGTEYPQWRAITAVRDQHGKITHYLCNFSDLSIARAAESRIQLLSHFDALTGLPNRALLQDRTGHSIRMMQRAGEPLTMMLLGIDHFKRITDSLGYQIRDHLLVAMAQRLSDLLREQDTVARLEGKDFVLVLPGTPPSGALHLATELLGILAQPFHLAGHELSVTASIGIASYPDDGSDFDSLFNAVEIAKHHAQKNGRATFAVYSEDLHQQVRTRDLMTQALRSAAALNQLQLVYQPLVDLQTGKISGLEALLRWHHPELGTVSPAKFIPMAEESGLIKGIGEWVLSRACSDIHTWQNQGLHVPHVAVNVSPLQFRDPDLIKQVEKAFSEYQIDATLLCLEVTEGALMDDVQRSEAMLTELKALGIKLSLDDFGTGYSSLSYLKRFPFDKVKIDQSFVRDITTSPSDNVLVKVIVAMAHGLGLKVIAEGVETEAQCAILRTHDCDEIQGYYFSKPVSAQAIEDIFNEGRKLPPHLLRLHDSHRHLRLDDAPDGAGSLMSLQ
jgi:diguanylate cyclase (GGDEF)-like protein/PAS domain S-box-containing protein